MADLGRSEGRFLGAGELPPVGPAGTLERLAYTYLGDWIERQTAGVRDDAAGAEERLAAARDLQQRLEPILEGEPPYDVYVRGSR